MKLQDWCILTEKEVLVKASHILKDMGYPMVWGLLPPDDYDQVPERVSSSVISGYSYYSKYKSIDKSHFVFCEGTIPIMLVAHVDTVFDYIPEQIFHDAKQKVMWSPEGLGADDRAGVYAIMQILKTGLRPHVLLTNGEETGGDGAYAFVENYKNTLKDSMQVPIHYIIQLDRKGNNEAVFYGDTNKDFIKYITKQHKWTKNVGSFTDISILCPAMGMSGVNVSVGYQNNHCESEFINTNHLNNTITKVCKMLEHPPTSMYIYSPSLFVKPVTTAYLPTNNDGRYKEKEWDEDAWAEATSAHNRSKKLQVYDCKYAEYIAYDDRMPIEKDWCCMNDDITGEFPMPCEWLCAGNVSQCECFTPYTIKGGGITNAM